MGSCGYLVSLRDISAVDQRGFKKVARAVGGVLGRLEDRISPIFHLSYTRAVRNSKSSEHQKDFFTCKDSQLYPVSGIVVCCTGYLGLLDAPLRTALVKSRLSTWGEKKPFNQKLHHRVWLRVGGASVSTGSAAIGCTPLTIKGVMETAKTKTKVLAKSIHFPVWGKWILFPDFWGMGEICKAPTPRSTFEWRDGYDR